MHIKDKYLFFRFVKQIVGTIEVANKYIIFISYRKRP